MNILGTNRTLEQLLSNTYLDNMDGVGKGWFKGIVKRIKRKCPPPHSQQNHQFKGFSYLSLGSALSTLWKLEIDIKKTTTNY